MNAHNHPLRSVLLGTLLALVILIGYSSSASAQSETVEQFTESAEGYKVYLYQSMIRMLNKDKDPEFNALIRDLDHLRFATTDSVGLSAKEVFRSLDKGIRTEGFEEVLTIDNADFKCHFYELSARGGNSTWVGVLYGMGQAGVMEMKGSLDLEHIDALSAVDMSSLKELLSLDIGNNDRD